MSSRNRYAVLDFETTGFGSIDRVVEVGIVLLDEYFEVEETWDSLIQPEREIPNSFVHKITDEDVVGAPLFSGIAGRLASMLAGRTMVAHNASFEQRFLRQEYARLGVVWPEYGNWVIDTKDLSKKFFGKSKLQEVLDTAGILNDRPHAALSDAMATASLLKWLVEWGCPQRGFDNGAQSIQYRLEQEDTTPLPAVSTIHRILTKNGYVIPQPKKRPRSSWIRFEADQPNETWQLDYSHWPLKNKRSAPILTIIDDHSRFVLACKAFDYETGVNVMETFITAGNTYGFPKSTLTDNGSVFTTKLYRKTDTRNGFEQLLLQMGIQQKNGTPYHPQTQGKVERFHATLQLHLKTQPPAHNIGELNHQLTAFINEYNNHRTHRSLNRRTPHQVYNFIPKAQPLDIPIGTDNRLRRDKVGSEGKVTLRYNGKLKKLYIGRKHSGKEVILICINKDITAVDPHNGEIWGKYELNPDKNYHPNLLDKPEPKPQK